MKKTVLYFTMFLLLPLAFFGQNASWSIVKYKVNFAIKNAGIKVDGSFSGLDATIIFDEKSTQNSFHATVAANTVNTGIDARNNHLKKASYFNVEKYPLIIIESNKITTLGSGKFLANCVVNMKGITNSFSMPFTFSYANNLGICKANMVLNRLDFNVGESSFFLDDDVIITIEIEAKKK